MKKPWYAFIHELWFHYVAIITIGVVMITMVTYGLLYRSPVDFPAHTVITIEEGQTLEEISYKLAQKGIVRDAAMFQIITTLIGGEHTVRAGDYYFEKPLSVYEVAYRVSHNKQHLVAQTITIPEGYTIYEMADRFERAMPTFDKVSFIKNAQQYRGKLFPDTYRFPPTTSADAIVTKMHKTFNKKIKPLKPQIASSTRSVDDIVIMASLLEKEAGNVKDRRMIAGVLWNRIQQDIPLQVDAAFSRVNGKSTYELTTDDLYTDAPFNTYTNNGLPPAPITNPSISSLKAALNPVTSEYLFYLSDRHGNTYYSKTLAEHQRKKRIYVN